MYEYKNVGDHPEDLAGGRIVGTSEYIGLTESELEDPHNKRLVDEGILIATGKELEGDTPAVLRNATDSAVELASAHGVDLSLVQGTGAGGRIIKEDVERHIEEEGGDL